MVHSVNMMSRADSVEGQGVSSAYKEQVELIKNMPDKYAVTINKYRTADITHYHTVNLRYYLTRRLMCRKGASVGYVHFLPETMDNSLNLPTPAKKFFYKYLIHFYKTMDYLVTVNPYFIGRLAAYGVPEDMVTYIPNFVSEETFFPITDKAAIRAKYGLEDKFTVLCAGQLQTRKGVKDFIECARQLPDIQFVWAGGFSFGKATDGYKELKKEVDNPLPNIKFLGIVPREEMNDIYNLANVMFLPSFEELFPMTILEAMNCRIPILLRDLEIYENILFDYYEKEPDIEGFLKTLQRLAQDKEYYELCCQNSWRGHEFYSRGHVSEMWDAFYSQVLCENKKCVKQNKKRNKKPLAETL